MFEYNASSQAIIGPDGSLEILEDDAAALKFIMLIEGECTKTGPLKAAEKFNFSKARYYQLLDAFMRKGIDALINRKTGPKSNYRRTAEITKLVIRSRFLDPDVSTEVIASRLQQEGHLIAIRSVERIINEYGLQKKTPHSIPDKGNSADRNTTDAK
jgi:transposase